MLDGVACDVKEQGREDEGQGGPPGSGGGGDEGLTFPDEESDDDERDIEAEGIVFEAGEDGVHPGEDGGLAEGGVTEEMEEGEPGPQQKEHGRFMLCLPPPGPEVVHDGWLCGAWRIFVGHAMRLEVTGVGVEDNPQGLCVFGDGVVLRMA